MAWAPDYVTTADLRAYATRSSVTVDDGDLALVATTASRSVDLACNRQFGLVDQPEARVYTPRWDRRRCRWLVEIDDLMTAVGLVVTLTAGTLTGFTLEPRNAPAKGRPWTLLVVDQDSTVTPAGTEYEAGITASWGWTTVPDPVKQAVFMQGNRFFARRTSPFGVAGSPELGSELRLLARLDPDVAVIVGPFVRWWGAA